MKAVVLTSAFNANSAAVTHIIIQAISSYLNRLEVARTILILAVTNDREKKTVQIKIDANETIANSPPTTIVEIY